mmetsp:Transcript_28660/g.58492  ORF Transcript_28660/g.58492 Transcript_28660/m.58492 type:complete len:282 (+) Transcript_28660:1642-2487(+)
MVEPAKFVVAMVVMSVTVEVEIEGEVFTTQVLDAFSEPLLDDFSALLSFDDFSGSPFDVLFSSLSTFSLNCFSTTFSLDDLSSSSFGSFVGLDDGFITALSSTETPLGSSFPRLIFNFILFFIGGSTFLASAATALLSFVPPSSFSAPSFDFFETLSLNLSCGFDFSSLVSPVGFARSFSTEPLDEGARTSILVSSPAEEFRFNFSLIFFFFSGFAVSANAAEYFDLFITEISSEMAAPNSLVSAFSLSRLNAFAIFFANPTTQLESERPLLKSTALSKIN